MKKFKWFYLITVIWYVITYILAVIPRIVGVKTFNLTTCYIVWGSLVVALPVMTFLTHKFNDSSCDIQPDTKFTKKPKQIPILVWYSFLIVASYLHSFLVFPLMIGHSYSFELVFGGAYFIFMLFVLPVLCINLLSSLIFIHYRVIKKKIANKKKALES